MPAIHLAALFGILLAVCCYLGFFLGKETMAGAKTKTYQIITFFLFFSALALRLAASRHGQKE